MHVMIQSLVEFEVTAVRNDKPDKGHGLAWRAIS